MYDVEQRAAAERSKTYWLLASLLLDQPSAAALKDLRAALDAAADGSPTLQTLRAALDAPLASPQAMTALQVEFTRLLRGVDGRRGPIEPVESLAREGRLFGESTEAALAAYQEAGFADIAPEAGPPDHAATELRFLSLLCFREMQAWQAQDTEAAAAWRARLARFVDAHIAPWLPAHCRSLHDAATTDFYRAVATVVAETCQADRSTISRSSA